MCYVVNKQYNLEAYFGHPGDAAAMVDHVGHIGQNNVRHSQVGTLSPPPEPDKTPTSYSSILAMRADKGLKMLAARVYYFIRYARTAVSWNIAARSVAE
jgi:hypothetical protein